MLGVKLPELAVNLLLNVINIIILFVIVKALVYKPVKKFLDNRTERVNDETAKAQKILDEANKTLLEKDKIFAESRAEGEKLAKSAYEEARMNAENIINEAKENARILEEKTKARLKTERESLIASSKDEIADLAINIAERILERETNPADNQKIVDDFFSKED